MTNILGYSVSTTYNSRTYVNPVLTSSYSLLNLSLYYDLGFQFSENKHQLSFDQHPLVKQIRWLENKIQNPSDHPDSPPDY